MIFKGDVKDGKLKIMGREAFDSYIKKFEGRTITLEVKRLTSSRSIQQNNYYWGVIIETLAKDWGYGLEEEKQTLSNVLADMFIDPTIKEVKIGDEIVQVSTRRGTSELDTKEFEEYTAKIRQWASQEYQAWIPEPNETDVYSLK